MGFAWVRLPDQAAVSFRTCSRLRFRSACQRTLLGVNRTCWLSQLFALVPRAMERRTAISGVMPARPLRMLDRVLRVTPRDLAASVMVRFRGSRQRV